MVKFCPKCGEKISENVTFCPECGVDVTTFNANEAIKEVEESEFHFWNLSSITLVYVGLLTAFLIYSLIINPSGILFFLYSIIMGYWCGSYMAKKYAPKINVSQSWAFAIGYTFSLIGLFCFWLYYLYKRDKTPSQKTPVKENTNGKPILKIIAIIIGIFILLVIGSYAILGSGSFTTQKQVVTTATLTPTGGSASFYTYENRTNGFKTNYLSSSQFNIKTTEYIDSYIFSTSELLYYISVIKLSSEYSASTVDDLTKIIYNDPLYSITQNKDSVLSGNIAREVKYTRKENNENVNGIARISKINNKVYMVVFETKTNIDLPLANTLFNSVIIQSPLAMVQTTTTSNYLQGSESNNPYAANAIYAQRILRCQQGMEDWDYCAQQCRLANQIGYKCNEQSLKQMWDENR